MVKTFTGKRIQDGKIPTNPGEYSKIKTGDTFSWYAHCPCQGELIGNLSEHKVIEHDDGTITVSPSILVTWREHGIEITRWHGFLEKGVWREC